jgi:DNA-binding NarL/FixJ family response regulator
MRKELENLVRVGVESFILKDATMDEFLRTMRSAAKKESVYSHQLTRSVFSRIVKQAIRKRKQRLRKLKQR